MPRHRLWRSIAFSLAALVGPAHADELVLTGVNVIDVERGTVSPSQTIVVAGGRIRSVGSGAPRASKDGGKVLDADGTYAIPALWDMHFHPWRVEDLTLFTANGVGGVRIMAGTAEHLAWRARIELGELIGPRLLVAGPIIEGRPPPELATVVDMDNRRIVETKAAAIAEVHAQKAAGFDYVKVYNNLALDVYRALASEARRQDMPLVGHVPFQVGLRGALEAGQSSIEHLRGYIERLVPASAPIQPGIDLRSRILAWEHADLDRMPELVRATRRAGTWLCPTLSTRIYKAPVPVVAEYLSTQDAEFLSRGNREMLRDRKTVKWLSNFSAADFERAGQGDVKENAFIRQLHAAGVPLLAGTDLGPAGFSLHGELERFVGAGLSPRDALEAATLNPVRFAGLEGEVGRVAPGYAADLVLLDANPLEDIRSTRRIRAVVTRGRLLERAELDRMLATVKAQYSTSKQARASH